MAGAVSGMMNFDDLADPEAMKRRDDVNSRMVSSMVGGGEGQSDSRYGNPPPSYYKQPPGNPDTSANELNKQELARVKGLGPAMRDTSSTGPKIDVNALPSRQEYQPKFTPAASEPPAPEPQKSEPEKTVPEKPEKPEPEKSAAPPPAPATPPPPSVPPPVPPKAEEPPKKDPEPAVAPIPPRDRFSGQKEDPAVERLSPVATAPIPRVRQATGQEGDAAVAALPPKEAPPKVEEPSGPASRDTSSMGPPSSSLKGDASRVVRSTFPPGSVKYNSKGEPYAASMDKMTPDEKAKVAEAYNSIREKSGASGSSGSDDVLERMRPRRRGAR